ncbi:MAG: leucine-rich repeat domain-containing protein, partial [Lachnospiraceae bacterium]
DESSVSKPSEGSIPSKPSDESSVSKPSNGSTPSKPSSGSSASEPSNDSSGSKPSSGSQKPSDNTEEPPHVHTPSETWSFDEEEHWHTCISCDSAVELDRASHTFTNWKTVKEATCTEEGKWERTCTVCGYTQTMTVPAFSHSYSDTWSYDADAHYHVCSECGAEDTRIAHTYGDWVTTKEPTLTQEGQKIRICLVCGYMQTEPIAALTPEPSAPSVDMPSSPSLDVPSVPSEAPSTPSIPSSPSEAPSIPSSPSEATPSVSSKPSSATSSQPTEQPLTKNATAKVKVKGAIYTYKVTNAKTNGSGTVKLIKTTSAATMSVPDKVKLKGHYYKVTAIDAKAFQKKTTVTSITIGNNVMKIPDSAFVGCKKLQKIVLGTGITKIGAKAFQNDSKLKTIVIRTKKLKTIGSKAFNGIYSKAAFTVPSSKKNSYKKMLTSSKGVTKKMKLKTSKS